MSGPHPHPTCGWSGVSPDDDEREVECDRPAQYVLEEPTGARTFSCAEHLSEMRAKAPGAEVRHAAQHLADEGHRRVSPESAIRWE